MKSEKRKVKRVKSEYEEGKGEYVGGQMIEWKSEERLRDE